MTRISDRLDNTIRRDGPIELSIPIASKWVNQSSNSLIYQAYRKDFPLRIDSLTMPAGVSYKQGNEYGGLVMRDQLAEQLKKLEALRHNSDSDSAALDAFDAETEQLILRTFGESTRHLEAYESATVGEAEYIVNIPQAAQEEGTQDLFHKGLEQRRQVLEACLAELQSGAGRPAVAKSSPSPAKGKKPRAARKKPRAAKKKGKTTKKKRSAVQKRKPTAAKKKARPAKKKKRK
jgi:hypothetical protein